MSTPKQNRLVEWATIASLLLVVVGIPLAQAVNDLRKEGKLHLLDLFTRFPSKENLHGWDAEARDRSIFGSAIRPKLLQMQYDLFGNAGAKAVVGKDGWLFYRPDVEFLVRPRMDQERFFLGTFDTMVGGKRVNVKSPLVAIRDVNRQLAARGIHLVVIPVPGKPTIYPEMLSGAMVDSSSSPTLMLLDSLRASGVDAVDLVTPLRQAKKVSKKDLYLHRDTHWSPAGVAVAADVISNRLLALPGVVARRDTTRYHHRDTTIERWGDICEMSALPKRREIWKSESVTASRVVDSAGASYSDSDSAAVLWLGDSYSRIYQTDEPKAAGIIAQVAKGIGQPLSSVVNDGGASTVVRRKLNQKPQLLKHAKVVVWEFVERDIRYGDKGWVLEELP
ncbi:MAG: hypothetical protein IPK50_04480 [Fibrobacterota bacterium]|nr:hypothetical protein [Fibrobacterota bacterium]QQS06152.1 MAG: hypothetical protein IPK50_04480 [Fibrobacterota bacterium]